MSEQSSQDRNLPASQRKLKKAREDGQVARSRDFGHFAAIAACGALLVTTAPMVGDWLKQTLMQGLQFDHAAILDGKILFLDKETKGAKELAINKLDVRVDDHAEPLVELARLENVARERFIHTRRTLGSWANPAGITDPAEREAVIAASIADAYE